MLLSASPGISCIGYGEAIPVTENEASLIELPDEFVRDTIKIAYRIYWSSKIELSATPLDSCPLIR